MGLPFEFTDNNERKSIIYLLAEANILPLPLVLLKALGIIGEFA